MAACGLNKYWLKNNAKKDNLETLNIIDLAFEMLNYSKEVVWGDGKKIKIKIGIHYGQTLAAVIGHHKPQFSLIGDTVNTTSRVCSNGKIGVVTISQIAFERVKDSGLYFIKKEIFVILNN